MGLYLDNASTTKPAQSVVDAFNRYVSRYANPSATYSTAGMAAKNDINEARKKVASYINACDDEIFFTSGATESNNWAIKGFVSANENCMSFITDIAEHPSVYNIAQYYLDKNELRVAISDVDSYGRFVPQDLEDLLKQAKERDPDDTPLVSVMMANNELGTINDIKALAEITHRYNGTIHVDATQALTHMPIDVDDLDIDMLSASGHKFGCFSGVGFLYVNKRVAIDPLFHGGHQENGMRAGTENYCYIMCMADRLSELSLTEQDRWNRGKELADKYFDITASVCSDNGLKCYCNTLGECLPNIRSITIPGIDASALISFLNDNNITVSAGSACNSGINEPSRVLKAVGLNDDLARNTIRLSIVADAGSDDFDYYRDSLSVFLKMLKN